MKVISVLKPDHEIVKVNGDFDYHRYYNGVWTTFRVEKTSFIETEIDSETTEHLEKLYQIYKAERNKL